MPAVQETVDRVRRIDVDQYRYGFETLIESEKAPIGLSEDTVRYISAKKNEPAWMLEWRLEAYRRWLTMTEPKWARVDYPRIDYQDLYYYSAPKPKKQIGSLDEIDPVFYDSAYYLVPEKAAIKPYALLTAADELAHGSLEAAERYLGLAERHVEGPTHRTSYLKLISNLEQVDLTEEAAILAEGYISRGIFHRKYIADALHVAIASYHKIDYLVTWNFGHLANVRRQARIRLFNTAAGFYVPMIVTPEFLVSEATEKVN